MRVPATTPLKTIALELVPPNVERGPQYAVDEAHKVLDLAAATGWQAGSATS